MQLKFASIIVDEQEKALKFYTDILGFNKMADMPMGEYRWLTVVSPEGIEGMELVLEPALFKPAAVFQKELFDAGVPAAALISKDIQKDFADLQKKGVIFRGEPKNLGPIIAVTFEDTCGNLINLVEPLIIPK